MNIGPIFIYFLLINHGTPCSTLSISYSMHAHAFPKVQGGFFFMDVLRAQPPTNPPVALQQPVLQFFPTAHLTVSLGVPDSARQSWRGQWIACGSLGCPWIAWGPGLRAADAHGPWPPRLRRCFWARLPKMGPVSGRRKPVMTAQRAYQAHMFRSELL